MEISKIQDALVRHLAAGDTYLAVSTVTVLANELADRVQTLAARVAELEGRVPREPQGSAVILPSVRTTAGLPMPPPVTLSDGDLVSCYVEDMGQIYDWITSIGAWVPR